MKTFSVSSNKLTFNHCLLEDAIAGRNYFTASGATKNLRKLGLSWSAFPLLVRVRDIEETLSEGVSFRTLISPRITGASFDLLGSSG